MPLLHVPCAREMFRETPCSATFSVLIQTFIQELLSISDSDSSVFNHLCSYFNLYFVLVLLCPLSLYNELWTLDAYGHTHQERPDIRGGGWGCAGGSWQKSIERRVREMWATPQIRHSQHSCPIYSSLKMAASVKSQDVREKIIKEGVLRYRQSSLKLQRVSHWVATYSVLVWVQVVSALWRVLFCMFLVTRSSTSRGYCDRDLACV